MQAEDKNLQAVRNRYNTSVIIKYPFRQMTLANEKAVYTCVNYGEAFCPGEIAGKSIVSRVDIGDILAKI